WPPTPLTTKDEVEGMEFVLRSPRRPALAASLRYRFRAPLDGMILLIKEHISLSSLNRVALPDPLRGCGSHSGLCVLIRQDRGGLLCFRKILAPSTHHTG